MPVWLGARARLTPDAPALRCGDVEWSFAELDRAARRTALALRAKGVRADDRVALGFRTAPTSSLSSTQHSSAGRRSSR
jgi:acyl-CoA synthetase (AMP-forming)/AMP-acid ligase II